MKKLFTILIAILLVTPFVYRDVFAQDLDSTNYRLVAPSTGEAAVGVGNSTNYASLSDSSPVDDFITTSTTYTNAGGTANFIEANVPTVSCFETSTNTGTCSIGSNGMQEVCSSPGCYDRAKIKIDSQSNPDDTRYAIQISTTSDFSSNVFYVDPTTRLIKTSFGVSDFIYQCEWEGTSLASYCASPNTTWQKYNILGLTPGTTYYARISALHGSSSDGSFTQSAWSTSATATTQNTSISVDIDIASSVGGSSAPPYIINLGTMIPDNVITSSNYIISRLTTNALSGVRVLIKGDNGGLLNGANLIANVNGDLAGFTTGYGLRNDSTTNSSNYSTYIGSITVSSTPSDFTDTGAADKVGSPTTSFVLLYSSNSLPLHTGVAGFRVKGKTTITTPTGIYSEILTYIPIGSY